MGGFLVCSGFDLYDRPGGAGSIASRLRPRGWNARVPQRIVAAGN
jgi:hypothetical protein